jgi:Flp pilus assembly protein TadG
MDRNGREGGQATIELALALPILVLVILAFLEASLVGADQVRVSHAAREGARVAAVKPETEAIEAAVRASGLSGAEVEIDPPPSQRTQGGAVTVTVRYHPRGHIPLIGELFTNLTLTSEATMRVEVP